MIRVLCALAVCLIGVVVMSGCNDSVDGSKDTGTTVSQSDPVGTTVSTTTPESVAVPEGIDKSTFEETIEAINGFLGHYTETTKDVAPPEYWEYLSDKGISREEIKKQIQDQPEKATNFYHNYKVTNVETMDSADWDEIKWALFYAYGIDNQSVTEGYAVKLCQTTTIVSYIEEAEEFADDWYEYETDVDVVAVKINDIWYMVSENGDFLWFDPRQ